MIHFRLYVRAGCPHCEQAIQWFRQRSVVSQIVDIGNDPVLNAGVKHWPSIVFPEESQRAGLGDQVPLLFSFASMKYVQGFRPEEYEKLANDAVQRSSPSAFGVDSAKGNGAEPSPDVAGESQSLAAGTD